MAPARKDSKKPAAKQSPARKKSAAADAKTAGKPAAPKAAGKKSAPTKKPARRRAAGRAPAGPAGAGVDRKSKLGRKWACFECGRKFYDLNHPEPICPRCGADQRARPKETTPPSPPPARVREPRPLAPLLDDDDAATRDTSLSGEDLDLEITALDDEDEITETPELELDEEEDVADED